METSKECPYETDILENRNKEEVEAYKNSFMLKEFPEKWYAAIAILKQSGMDLDRIKLVKEEK